MTDVARINARPKAKIRSAGVSDHHPWETKYLAGADGARSTVRKEIGADFESENAFVIVDLDETPENPREKERVSHYDNPDAADGTSCLSRLQVAGASMSSANPQTT